MKQIDFALGDRICIHGIEVDCIIGIADVERRERQRILLDLDLYCDLKPAGKSDSIHDTLDYKWLRDQVCDVLGGSRDGLIERLAQRVADQCLAFEQVLAVRVRLAKPGALTGARSVAVSITRLRDGVNFRSSPS